MADNDQTNENKQANEQSSGIGSDMNPFKGLTQPCPSCGYCPICGQRRYSGNYQYWPYGYPVWTSGGSAQTEVHGTLTGGTIHGL